MKRYVVKRIFSGLLTVLLVFTLNFVIIKAAPGDPIKTLMGKENSDPQLRAALEEKWGLNQPQYVQYFNYLRNAVQGDLGTSITYNQSVNKLIAEKVGPTVLLGVAAAIVAHEHRCHRRRMVRRAHDQGRIHAAALKRVRHHVPSSVLAKAAESRGPKAELGRGHGLVHRFTAHVQAAGRGAVPRSRNRLRIKALDN